jgi:hypothetical protein
MSVLYGCKHISNVPGYHCAEVEKRTVHKQDMHCIQQAL